jgi:hypothetical protein
VTKRQQFPHQKYLDHLEECRDARRRELAAAEAAVTEAVAAVGIADAALAAAIGHLDEFRRRSRIEGGRRCTIADIGRANAQEDLLRGAVEQARQELLAAEQAREEAVARCEFARNKMQEALDEYQRPLPPAKQDWDAEQNRLEAKREDKESSDAWNSRNIARTPATPLSRGPSARLGSRITASVREQQDGLRFRRFVEQMSPSRSRVPGGVVRRCSAAPPRERPVIRRELPTRHAPRRGPGHADRLLCRDRCAPGQRRRRCQPAPPDATVAWLRRHNFRDAQRCRGCGPQSEARMERVETALAAERLRRGQRGPGESPGDPTRPRRAARLHDQDRPGRRPGPGPARRAW